MIDVGKQEHYTALSPEPIEVIRSWKLGFNLGNVVKYIGRCELKGDKLQDLRKARQYLDWEVEELEAQLEAKEKQMRADGWELMGNYWVKTTGSR